MNTNQITQREQLESTLTPKHAHSQAKQQTAKLMWSVASSECATDTRNLHRTNPATQASGSTAHCSGLEDFLLQHVSIPHVRVVGRAIRSKRHSVALQQACRTLVKMRHSYYPLLNQPGIGLSRPKLTALLARCQLQRVPCYCGTSLPAHYPAANRPPSWSSPALWQPAQRGAKWTSMLHQE